MQRGEWYALVFLLLHFLSTPVVFAQEVYCTSGQRYQPAYPPFVMEASCGCCQEGEYQPAGVHQVEDCLVVPEGYFAHKCNPTYTTCTEGPLFTYLGCHNASPGPTCGIDEYLDFLNVAPPSQCIPCPPGLVNPNPEPCGDCYNPQYCYESLHCPFHCKHNCSAGQYWNGLLCTDCAGNTYSDGTFLCPYGSVCPEACLLCAHVSAPAAHI